MFGLGLAEIVVILVLALLVLGPDKLPGIAKQIGKGVREFRRAASEFQAAIQISDDFMQRDHKNRATPKHSISQDSQSNHGEANHGEANHGEANHGATLHINAENDKQVPKKPVPKTKLDLESPQGAETSAPNKEQELAGD
ncbi:MAG: twin-arginine translocase TatA/TatE family subunit [Myxococcota bacterium]|nr:twin-arginine translocase TatA/TatE family subunit [Myxococcota bacterium]